MRCFEAEAVNGFLNDPAIRPTIGGDGVLDAAALLSDPRNICLMREGGGAMFAWRGPDIYEGHSFFRCRGRAAVRLGIALMAEIFCEHGARLVWGLTPEPLRHVRMFNRWIGMQSKGLMDTPDGPCELFVMEA